MDQQLAAPTLGEIAGALRRHVFLAVAMAVAVAVGGALYLNGPDAHSATARIEIGRGRTEESDGLTADNGELERLNDPALKNEVERALPGLQMSVTAASGGIFNVTATGPAESVAEGADRYAKLLVERRQDDLTQLSARRVQAIEARLKDAGILPGSVTPGSADSRAASLLADLDDAQVEAQLIDQRVKVLTPAVTSTASGTATPMLLFAAALMGGLAGLAAPFVLELLRGRVMGAPDLRRLAGPYPALDGPARATPVLVRLAMAADPGARAVIAVSPVDALSGGQLARSLAAQFCDDASPVLVCASPGAEAGAGGAGEPGLLGVLKRGLPAREAVVRDAEEHLAVVPLGDGDPHLLNRPRLAEVLAQLAGDHTPVVISGPPLNSAEGQAVAAAAGRVVVTVRAGTTKMSVARAALEQLEASGATIVGLVIDPVVP